MLGNFLWYYYNNIFLFNWVPNSDWYFLTRISYIQKEEKKILISWTKMFHENITDSKSWWGNTDPNALVPSNIAGKPRKDPASLACKACIDFWSCSTPKPGWWMVQGEHSREDLETDTPSLQNAVGMKRAPSSSFQQRWHGQQQDTAGISLCYVENKEGNKERGGEAACLQLSAGQVRG